MENETKKTKSRIQSIAKHLVAVPALIISVAVVIASLDAVFFGFLPIGRVLPGLLSLFLGVILLDSIIQQLSFYGEMSLGHVMFLLPFGISTAMAVIWTATLNHYWIVGIVVSLSLGLTIVSRLEKIIWPAETSLGNQNNNAF